MAGGSGAAALAGKWGEAGAAFCVSAPLLFTSAGAGGTESVSVYERGFVWKRGRRREVVRWEDVADLEAETIEDKFRADRHHRRRAHAAARIRSPTCSSCTDI